MRKLRFMISSNYPEEHGHYIACVIPAFPKHLSNAWAPLLTTHPFLNFISLPITLLTLFALRSSNDLILKFNELWRSYLFDLVLYFIFPYIYKILYYFYLLFLVYRLLFLLNVPPAFIAWNPSLQLLWTPLCLCHWFLFFHRPFTFCYFLACTFYILSMSKYLHSHQLMYQISPVSHPSPVFQIHTCTSFLENIMLCHQRITSSTSDILSLSITSWNLLFSPQLMIPTFIQFPWLEISSILDFSHIGQWTNPVNSTL